MKFFLEKNKDAGYRVTIEIPETIVKQTVYKELYRISKNVNINGFRKGKVPINIIQKKYGNTVHYDVFNKMMQKYFYKFIQQKKIKIIGSPKYEISENLQDQKNLKYSVIYELYPNVNIEDINLIKAPKIIVPISDEEIKEQIKKNKENIIVWNKVNRTIKNNDRVTINYQIYDNKKEITKFRAENVTFIISNNTFVSLLNQKLINHYTDDILFFKIKFSDFHPEQDLQKKDITFKVYIKKVEEKQILKNNKTSQDSIELNQFIELNYKKIKDNLVQKIKILSENYLKNQIIKKLIQKNSIKIPLTLLKEEIKFLKNKYIKEYKEKKHSILEEEYHNDIGAKARDKIHINLIIQKIITDNKIVSNPIEIQSLVQQISKCSKKPSEIINFCKKNKDLIDIIKNIELDRKIMSFLLKKIKIYKKYLTLEEAINFKWINNITLFE
ncbi:trigger factor [Buchnera aphidicola (Muscaphis stroyani)]|uniref:Trigger factor n=1 Tax=Buchnera aphidicola (Muscaphis stroyani) TaxID=1241869 RepID=A0A4D6Y518_9GAMM|nr:trigger factor [Buchnera aphidicola]QCI24512.1 trigger factor [Buchnera aphidicola (Muscaphis stroyani)]